MKADGSQAGGAGHLTSAVEALGRGSGLPKEKNSASG